MWVIVISWFFFLLLLPSIHTFVSPKHSRGYIHPRFLRSISLSNSLTSPPSAAKQIDKKKTFFKELSVDLNTTYSSSIYQYKSLYNSSSIPFKHSIFPSSIGRELKYDPLATNSLEAIEFFPFIPKKKTDSFLISWWNGMKSWGLVSNSMINEIEGLKKKKNNNKLSSYYNSTSIIALRLRQISEKKRARLICIGDVHGCFFELQELLKKIELLPGDVVLFLGDMIEKGPYSAEVIRLAMDIGAIGVRGNHDHRVIRRCFNTLKKFQEENNDEYNKYIVNNTETDEKNDLKLLNHRNIWPKEIHFRDLTFQELKWLSELPVYIKSPDLGCAFVHGGFDDHSYAKTVSSLNSTHSEHFISEFDFLTQSPITMMTLRSVTPQNSTSEISGTTQCSWASLWQGPYTVIFGHDSKRGLRKYENALGLDTGCVYGGRLTAIILPNGDIVSTPSYKAYIPLKS